MDIIPSLTLLALLLAANGAPVIIRYFMQERFNNPLDGGILFIDGRPVLGAAKTVRGVVGAIIVAALLAPVMGVSVFAGLTIGVLAMAGDILSSFIKRRLGIRLSGNAPVLDHVPEALFPTVVAGPELGLDWKAQVLVVAGFVLIGALVSRVLAVSPARRNQ